MDKTAELKKLQRVNGTLAAKLVAQDNTIRGIKEQLTFLNLKFQRLGKQGKQGKQ